MTYSVHFRKKVLSVREKEGLSFTSISKKFNIGRNTIFIWTKKLHPQKHRDKKAIKIDPDKLRQDVIEYCDAYQYERAERLGVSRSGIQRAHKKLNITYKKVLRHPKAKEEERLAFQDKIKNYKSQGKCIVFIDESGFVENALRTHGYSIKGTRCYGINDWHPSKRTNVIVALIGKSLLTVSLFECNINSTVFN